MIITDYHIALYKKFGGDVDHLQRAGSTKEKTPENEEVISIMSELISNLQIIKNGMASEVFSEKVNDELRSLCSNEIVIQQLKELMSFE
jgi:hypothetical protein